MGSLRLTVTLVTRGPAAAVVLTEAQIAAIGDGAKRFPVVATVNGYTWRTTVTRMGGEFLLGLSRGVREQAGVEAGDTVDVELELDTAPREVDLPEALAAALAQDAEAHVNFERLHPPQGICPLDRRGQARRDTPTTCCRGARTTAPGQGANVEPWPTIGKPRILRGLPLAGR